MNGFTTLYGTPDSGELATGFGTFAPDANKQIVVPDIAIDVCLSHGFFRSPEDAAKAYAKTHSPAGVVASTATPGAPAAPAPAPALSTVTAEERVAKADRFALMEYCEANEIQVPPRTTNVALRAMVLAHIHGEQKQ